MEPLCVHENRRCVNHGFEDWPVIEIVNPDGKFEKEVTHLLVLYVLGGNLELSFGTVRDYALGRGHMMLFPPGSRVAAVTDDDAAIMLLKIKNRFITCDKYLLGNLAPERGANSTRHTHLEAVPMVRSYMEQLAENVSGPLQCYRFMEIKIVELFHYLRAYYSPQELSGFVLPLMSPNAQFMFFVWNNYRKAHNVNQFARLANCSLSAFKVKFKNVTGMPPSQWLAQQKARNVFHEISSGRKSLKEISEEYHFSSVSHLGTFCRKNFGQSPGSLKPGRENRDKKTVDIVG